MGLVNWFRSLFSRSNKKEEGVGRLDVYYPFERQIFVYWNGKVWVKADPMVLYKKVVEVGPELSVDIKVASSPLMKAKDAGIAHSKMIAKLRNIFNVAPIEEEGLTEPEVEDLYIQFMEYNDWVKKNLNPSVTVATEASPPSPPSSDIAPATTSSTDSSSTPSVSGTGEPVLSATESPSPTSK